MSHVHTDFYVVHTTRLHHKTFRTLIATDVYLLFSKQHSCIWKHVILYYICLTVLVWFRPQNSQSDFCIYYWNTLYITKELGKLSQYTNWLQAGEPGFNSQQVQKIFVSLPDSLWYPIEWVPGVLSLGVMKLEHEANHSPPSSAKVMKEWSCISTTPCVFREWCLASTMDNLAFTFYIQCFVCKCLQWLFHCDMANITKKCIRSWERLEIMMEMYEVLESASEEETLNCTVTFKWFDWFQKRRISGENYPCPRRPASFSSSSSQTEKTIMCDKNWGFHSDVYKDDCLLGCSTM